MFASIWPPSALLPPSFRYRNFSSAFISNVSQYPPKICDTPDVSSFGGKVVRFQGDGERALQRRERAGHAPLPHPAVVLVRGGNILHLRRLPARVRAQAQGPPLAQPHHHVQRLALLHRLLLRLRRLRAHPQEGPLQISGMRALVVFFV